MNANGSLKSVYAELCDAVAHHEEVISRQAEEPNNDSFIAVKSALSNLGLAIDSLPELEPSQLT